MPGYGGLLSDIQACCAWPECRLAPDVQVKYLRREARDSRLARLPAERGIVNLCLRHASEFGDAVKLGCILSVDRPG